MTTWLLILWITGLFASASQVPIRVFEYQTREKCEAAVVVWKAVRHNEAMCLPTDKTR